MQPIDIYISYLGINDWYCVLIYNLSYFYLWLLKIILHKPINGWLIFTCFMYLWWYSCTMHLHAYMCRTCRQLSQKLEMGFGYPENGVRDGCEALDVGVRNWIWIFCKSIKYPELWPISLGPRHPNGAVSLPKESTCFLHDDIGIISFNFYSSNTYSFVFCFTSYINTSISKV